MPNKLTQEEAYQKVIDRCKEISTPDEEIRFLGWVDGEYKRNTSKLILYNSKLDISWSSMSFNNFMKKDKIIKTPKSGVPKDKQYLVKNGNRKSSSEFIDELKMKHSDKNWDYSKVNYKGYHEKVCIICHEIDPITGREHGEFWSELANLLSSKSGNGGCPKCSGKYQMTTEEFKEKASIVHKEKYTYDKAIYINSSTKILVTCPEHGDFWTIPTNHIHDRYGCPECKKEYLRDLYSKTQEEFEKEVIEKFGSNKYDLSQSKYVNIQTPVKIRCIEHNTWFYQRPSDLLSGNYRGCPECQKKYRGEIAVYDYLKNHGINFTQQYRIDSDLIEECPNKVYIKVDFAIEYDNRKIWIEYNGEQHYEYKPYFQKSYSNFERQQLRDQSLREYAKSQGIELLEIPYTDLHRIPEILDAFLRNGVDITTKI